MPVARTPDTRQQILLRLKTKGPLTSSQVAEWLEVTSVAARRHLHRLQEHGLVHREDRRGGVGRPSQVWELTDAAHRGFHDGHADLAVRLLEAVRGVFGADGLEEVLDAVAEGDMELAEARMAPTDTSTRVEALASLRRDQGYMAETSKDPDTGAYYLIENHCPVEDAVDNCDSLCERELTLFRRLLGDGYDVTRTEHIGTGDRRCVYCITAVDDDVRRMIV